MKELITIGSTERVLFLKIHFWVLDQVKTQLLDYMSILKEHNIIYNYPTVNNNYDESFTLSKEMITFIMLHNIAP